MSRIKLAKKMSMLNIYAVVSKMMMNVVSMRMNGLGLW